MQSCASARDVVSMIDNPELQDLYRTVADVLDGYNRTHDVQVVYVDFEARVPDYSYSGSVVCREYPDSIIDYHYRDLRDDDFYWFKPEDWPKVCLDREAIAAANRKEAQRAHREGRKLSDIWHVKHRNNGPIFDPYDPVW